MKLITTLEEVITLIQNEILENIKLEYKKEFGSNKEISKDISAFANTYGGDTIYGVSEVNGKPSLPINWLDNKGIKEKIEQIINSHINPKLENVEIIRIDKTDDNTKSIFIINIPISINAPHMALDNKYYIRRNSVSIPMTDSEVRNTIFTKGFRDSLIEELEFNNSNGQLIGSKYEEVKRSFDGSLSADKQQYRGIETTVPKREIVFTPFQTEAWQTVRNSGLFAQISIHYRDLIKLYNIIHRANHIIELQKHSHYIIHNEETISGIYLPALVTDLAQKIHPLADKILKQLKQNE